MSSAPSQSGSYRVVLVDDEPHITRMVERRLAQLGYEVRTAGDGQQGLNLIHEVMPDLVVTDLQMPYMSGIELATRLWSSEKTKGIPVVMLTARGFIVEQQISDLKNIRALLSKPFSTRSLVDQIGSILGGGTGDATGRVA
jgi:DNA-binding response OmpR family regulator